MSEPAHALPLPVPWLSDPGVFAMDRFQVGPELGRGAMGIVHEAWDPALGRRVAVKLLHSTDPGAVLGLFREAQAQARLDHPGICRIFELGEAKGIPYIAMQRVEGVPLGELASTLTVTEVAAILAEVAQAMGAAHAAGLVHRDLKPQNILVETRSEGGWRPVVVDFGLAVDLTSSERSLAWGLAGTPAFMSPEQARGEPLTRASDVYSLGATLFAMLSGRPPFEAVTLAHLFQQQEETDAPRVRRLAPDVPRDLDLVVAKCLEADPSQRYPSAGELEEDLRRFLAGEPPKGRPTPWTGRLLRAARRQRRYLWTLAATLLGLTLLAGWSLPRIRQVRRRMAAAQHFGSEVKALEGELVRERLLPSHDLQPAEGAMAAGLERLRRELRNAEPVAQGPGHFALGRGRLAVADWPGALEEFHQARAAGFQGPELDYATGLAHFGLYVGGRLPFPGEPAPPEATLAGHLGAARALLRQGRPSALEAGPLAEARLAFLGGDLDRCLAVSAQALREQPALGQAHLLAAQALMERASTANAVQALTQAERELDQAQTIARSDPELRCWRLRLEARWGSGQGTALAGARLQARAQAARQALALRPGEAGLWRACAVLLAGAGRQQRAWGAPDPGWLGEQLALLQKAPPGVNLDPALADLREQFAVARSRRTARPPR